MHFPIVLHLENARWKYYTEMSQIDSSIIAEEFQSSL